MHKFLAFLAVGLMLSLTACLPVAFMGGAAATAVIVNDSRGVDTVFADRNIAYQTELRLAKDQQLKNSANISVSAFNYNVLLLGQVPTRELSNRATEIAKHVPKVKHVYNQIAIEKPLTTLSESSDAWLTTKVKTAMLNKKGLRSSQIKVITENSVVYLMGLITRAQGDLAAEAASEVEGVQRVVKVFEYTNS